MIQQVNITILGAGAWGTALAISLCENHQVTLWARNSIQCAQLKESRCNTKYLPTIPFPSQLIINSELASSLQSADLLILAPPISGLRDLLNKIKQHDFFLHQEKKIIWVCKGFEEKTAKLPHQIVQEIFDDGLVYATLSGPSFAIEVAQGQPTALTLASSRLEFAQKWARELRCSRLRIYSSNDLVGVEVAAAVKNVIAIAVGMSDGLNLGYNARAALITRGLAEITRLGMKMGGRSETFMGLAGMGDLILTCTSDLSRNRRVGLMLAQGKKLSDILKSLGHVAEGVYSAAETLRLAHQYQVEMPICEAVCQVLCNQITPKEVVEKFLNREPKSEY